MGTQPFIAEIRIFAGNFPPRGWAFCNGQLLSIAQNTALFSILGTFYGGNGTTNFALPNLQAAAPLHEGNGAGLTPRVLGETGGVTAVTLQLAQIPAHSHTAGGNAGGGLGSPSNNVWGAVARGRPGPYVNSPPNTSMSPQALAVAGGSQPHNNVQPYLALTFIIALQGVFPSRN